MLEIVESATHTHTHIYIYIYRERERECIFSAYIPILPNDKI